MLSRWKAPSTKLGPRLRGLQRFVARRQALSTAFPGELLVIPSGSEKVRANDTNYRFRPGTDFYYFTGNMEADGVLVLWPTRSGHRSELFVQPHVGRTDPSFFNDRNGELWVGPRLGVHASKHRFGVEAAAPLATLPARLKGYKKAHRLLCGVHPATEALLPKPRRPQQRLNEAFAAHLSEMRLIKDPLEVAALVRACDATRRGFEDVIATLKDHRFGGPPSERQVEGVFNLRARVEGNDVGYGSIAASGEHACILHWTDNDGPLRKTDLLLLDAGVEGRELYTADVTRTLPIGGRFSPVQRQIYDLVWAAQQAAFAQVAPGNDFLDPHRAAMRVLTEGLCALKILKVSAEVALDPQNMFYRRYTLHGVSHMLGLDVHDCAAARAQTYRYGTLQPGMVLTIEPGLYFQPDDLTVPARFRGIGVRIEDDVCVSRTGYRLLSELPNTSRDVEAWMQQIWRQKRRNKGNK
jgi:Xaa-Pro aminopeptidase